MNKIANAILAAGSLMLVAIFLAALIEIIRPVAEGGLWWLVSRSDNHTYLVIGRLDVKQG